MTIIPSPRKIKIELMSNEIETIIDELIKAPHDIYDFLCYKKIVDKLNKALEKR